MKRHTIILHFLACSAMLLLFVNCTGGNNSNPMSVDELMTNAETLVDKTVIVEGLCTHVCSKSGMKLFLQGADETKIVRAESGATLGKFDPASTDKKVRIRGKLVEEQPTENNPVAHGEDGEACETEEAAHKSYHIAAESYQIID
ncbi:hypothetical protein [Proteiniphilum sp. UBA1028]|jgi:hypothetical protein|uniref:hypothetical protein n=1 Tax=Proteiniphilum sp. UBA1028 TaxID=1947251 RepID=UPI0025FDA896|nr:hypothetical protein [Proteiniphilum sp. UBA1028]